MDTNTQTMTLLAGRLMDAAREWRENWIDFEDEIEMQGGCDCKVCQLVRAIDGLRAHVEKVKSKQ